MCARAIVEAAWKWAAKTGNLRKNEIHGEEEARLLLSDTFTLLDEEGQEINMSGNFEVDASCQHPNKEGSPACLCTSIIYIYTHTLHVYITCMYMYHVTKLHHISTYLDIYIYILYIGVLYLYLYTIYMHIYTCTYISSICNPTFKSVPGS